MKKVLALILAVLMVLALVACGAEKDAGKAEEPKKSEDAPKADTKPADDSKPAADDGPIATPNANEDGSVNLDKVAHYDPSFDYTVNPQWTMCYMGFSADVGYQQTADAYEIWCKPFNLKWTGFVSANNSVETFFDNLQVYLDQGTDIIVMDPDITTFPRIYDIIKEYPDTAWMSMLGPARDYVITDTKPSGELLRPFVGFDFYESGVLCAENLTEWLTATYPDADYSEVGFVGMTLSTSPPLAARERGVADYWLAMDGIERDVNYFTVDLASYGLTMQGGQDAMAPVVATNSQLKYWLVFGMIDDAAVGAANVLENAHLTETSCVNACGGPGLQMQLDAGQTTAYRYAYALPSLLYAEPCIGACYAFKAGYATPDTLWPSWVRSSDHGGEGHAYGQIQLPSYFIGAENYKEVYEWSDIYAGADYYPYGDDVDIDINYLTTFVDPPAGYKDT